MLFLVDSDSETVKKLEEFHPEVEVEPSKDEEEILGEAAGKGEDSCHRRFECSHVAKQSWRNGRLHC